MKEEWREVPDWTNYEVSSFGRVRRAGKLLKLVPVQSGSDKAYAPLRVSLSDRTRRWDVKVALLVLIVFVRKKRHPRELIRHLDDSQENNKVSNLRWGSNKENGDDRVKNGVSRPGETNGNSVLTSDAVKAIRIKYKKHSRGASGAMGLAATYNVSVETIYNILNNITWKHV